MARAGQADPTIDGEVVDNPDAIAANGKNSSAFNVTDLRNIASFDDAIALVQRTYGDDAVKQAEDEIGSGFIVLPTSEKGRLVNVPFIILSVDFNEGDQGPFVSAMIVTKFGERLIVNDGSTGIYAQLDDWYGRSPYPGGLLVKGLRESRYEVEIDGKMTSATTYYLNV